MSATHPHDRLFIGVMTGTSMDAIDVAVVRVQDQITLGHVTRQLSLAHFHSKPLDPSLADAMLALQTPTHDELHRTALIGNVLADAIGRAILETIASHGLRAKDIVAAGVHGQTVRHQPQSGYTLALNAPARIAEATGITVVSNFRDRDIAAGGQGAPLVPRFHQTIFQHDPSIRAVVNIGGIANITVLNNPLLGYDTGPGNMLINHWVQQHHGQRFDDQGAWAATGKAHAGLLAAMLSEPFFQAPAPKSTGRDLFNAQWLNRFLDQSGFANIAPEDVQATLTELTAVSIAHEIARHLNCAKASENQTVGNVLVCGGGVQNTELMRVLAKALNAQTAGRCTIASTEQAGWAPQVIESAAFAWLAAQAMDGLPGNCPSVTGALGERVLGCITPA
jgi:anhydro-N-acetylmuramic acid kinase